MDPLLSAEELDALKQTQVGDGIAPRDVRPVDLIACDHRAFSQMPALQSSAERLAKGIEGVITRILRTPCRVNEMPVEIVPGNRLRELWGMPRFVYSLSLMGQENSAAIAIDSLIGNAYISRQFGGDIEAPTAIERECTKTERVTVARLGGMFMTALVEALKPISDVEAELRVEKDETPSGPAVVLFGVNVALGEYEGRITVVVDTNSGCFDISQAKKRQEIVVAPQGEMIAAVQNVHMDLRVVLGKRPITMREFFALQEGDIITLDTPVDGHIDVQVAGKRKFSGKPKLQRGQLSVELCETIRE